MQRTHFDRMTRKWNYVASQAYTIQKIEEMQERNDKADSYIRLLDAFPEHKSIILARMPVKLRSEVELFYEL